MAVKKTHWRVEDNLNYLGAYSFQPNEIKTLTIEKVERETIKNPQEKKEDTTKKNIIYFVENEKPMIANQLNSKTLSNLFKSNYIEDWNGKQFMLRVEDVRAFGETVQALRVVPQLPKQKRALNSHHKSWKDVIQAISEGNLSVHKLLQQYNIPKKDIDALKELEVKENA